MNHIRFIFLSITATIALFGTETPGPVAQQQCSHIVRRLSSYKTEEHIDEIIKSVQSVAQEKQIDEALLFKSLCRKLKAVQYQYEIKIKHPKRRYIAGFAIGAALFFFAYTFYKIAKQEAQDILDDQIRLKEEEAAKAEVYKALQRQGASAFVYDGRVSVHYPIWANRAELERLCRRLAILSLPFRGKAPIEALRTGDSTIAMIIAATGGLFLTAAAIYDWYNEYYAEFYYQRLTVIIQRLEQHWVLKYCN